MRLTTRALRAIESYRHSRLHDEVAGCCRFTPSCSHYAEDALEQRALPVALLLVVWRLLRCTPLTPRGTVDPVPLPGRHRLRRPLAVLAVSALTTLLVGSTAAAAARFGGGSTTAGGCDAFVGGVPIGNLDKNHRLQVSKGQRVVLTGRAPAAVRTQPATATISSSTDVKIVFVESIATHTFSEHATGATFQKSVNVDTYLKYGSGIYRVDVHSVAASGWDCSATFYVELNGSKLAADIAIALGCVGAVGVVASTGGGKPEVAPAPVPVPDEEGVYDPGIAPDALDRAQAGPPPERDMLTDIATSGAFGCLVAAFLWLTGATGGFLLAAPVPGAGRRRLWVRGHAVRGFVSGLVAGLGFTVAMQQYGQYPFTVATAIVVPLAIAVLGALRAWWGRPWKVPA
jgi:putative component of membrane protein insertase Oxa1/YidC/SpoIIIJ protein YidD